MPAPYPGMLSNKTAIPKTQPSFGLGSFQSPQTVPTPQPTMQAPQAPAMQTPQTSTNYQDMGAADQFKLFQSNPEVGQSEIARATNQANLYKATGDMDKYNAAEDWLGKVNTVMAGVQTPKPVNPYEQQQAKSMQDYNDTLGQFRQQLATPFAYNPATDQQAQAYKAVFDNQAKEGSRNAMEAMNSRGLLNSSMTAGEIAKAEQDAGLQYGAKLADLGQQAYQRNQDSIQNTGRLIGYIGDQQQRMTQQGQWERTFDYNSGRDKVKDSQWQQGQEVQEGQLTGDYNGQRTVAGRNADTNEMQAMAQLTGKLPDGTRTSAQQQIALSNLWKAADASGTIPDELADMYGLPHGTQTVQAKQIAANIAHQNEQLRISQQNADTSSRNADRSADNEQLDSLYKQWQYTGKAPAGIPGVAEGTPYRTEANNNPASKVDPKDSADNYSVIISDLDPRAGVTKDKAKQLAQANRDHLSDTDYRKLIDYIEKEF